MVLLTTVVQLRGFASHRHQHETPRGKVRQGQAQWVVWQPVHVKAGGVAVSSKILHSKGAVGQLERATGSQHDAVSHFPATTCVMPNAAAITCNHTLPIIVLSATHAAEYLQTMQKAVQCRAQRMPHTTGYLPVFKAAGMPPFAVTVCTLARHHQWTMWHRHHLDSSFWCCGRASNSRGCQG
jgi:hypothetical protein